MQDALPCQENVRAHSMFRLSIGNDRVPRDEEGCASDIDAFGVLLAPLDAAAESTSGMIHGIRSLTLMRLRVCVRSPAFRRLRGAVRSPAFRRLRGSVRSPAFRRLRGSEKQGKLGTLV